MPGIKGWWREAGYATAFALITLAAAFGATVGADEAVRAWVKAHQIGVLHGAAKALNYLGQGAVVTWALAGGLTLWALWRTRAWKTAVPWLSAFALTYLTLGGVKLLTERDSPNSKLPNAVEFFNDAATYTMSYPSGHVVNAIVWWGVIAMLLGRRLLAIRVAVPVIVFCTTIYLGHHWLTDNLGALALGLLILGLVQRIKMAFS